MDKKILLISILLTMISIPFLNKIIKELSITYPVFFYLISDNFYSMWERVERIGKGEENDIYIDRILWNSRLSTVVGLFGTVISIALFLPTIATDKNIDMSKVALAMHTTIVGLTNSFLGYLFVKIIETIGGSRDEK